MCGRFTITVSLEELYAYFKMGTANLTYAPRYNAAPGQMIPAVISQQGINRLGELKWGLIPSWAKEEKIGYMMINAKAETIQQKPAFKEAFQRRRCIIPADGFYEWKKEGKTKQPMRIKLKNKSIFSMAGLYDTWMAPDGRKVHSCTIITTTANTLIGPIHDRMPVILHPKDESTWLNREMLNAERLQSLLSPYPAEAMEFYPVSPKVGSAKYDVPDCIAPFEIQKLF